METGKTSFLIRPIRPEEYEALGELTVAAYHSIPAEMPHQEISSAGRSSTSRPLRAST